MAVHKIVVATCNVGGGAAASRREVLKEFFFAGESALKPALLFIQDGWGQIGTLAQLGLDDNGRKYDYVGTMAKSGILWNRKRLQLLESWTERDLEVLRKEFTNYDELDNEAIRDRMQICVFCLVDEPQVQFMCVSWHGPRNTGVRATIFESTRRETAHNFLKFLGKFGDYEARTPSVIVGADFNCNMQQLFNTSESEDKTTPGLFEPPPKVEGIPRETDGQVDFLLSRGPGISLKKVAIERVADRRVLNHPCVYGTLTFHADDFFDLRDRYFRIDKTVEEHLTRLEDEYVELVESGTPYGLRGRARAISDFRSETRNQFDKFRDVLDDLLHHYAVRRSLRIDPYFARRPPRGGSLDRLPQPASQDQTPSPKKKSSKKKKKPAATVKSVSVASNVGSVASGEDSIA